MAYVCHILYLNLIFGILNIFKLPFDYFVHFTSASSVEHSGRMEGEGWGQKPKKHWKNKKNKKNKKQKKKQKKTIFPDSLEGGGPSQDSLNIVFFCFLFFLFFLVFFCFFCFFRCFFGFCPPPLGESGNIVFFVVLLLFYVLDIFFCFWDLPPWESLEILCWFLFVCFSWSPLLRSYYITQITLLVHNACGNAVCALY